MKITCAISPKQIENLYKHAYAKMYKALQQNESFDAEAYMRDLFNAISKSKDDATAANGAVALQLDPTGNAIISGITTMGLSSSSTPPTNSQMSFALTSNTNLRISVRGTDGVVRTANITLA